jgi:hypothetical protein
MPPLPLVDVNRIRVRELLEVLQALCGLSGCSRFVQHRKQHRHKNGDNSDDNEQLDQREPETTLGHDVLPRKELINDPNRFVRSRLIFSSFVLSTFAKERNATAALYLFQTIGVESLFSEAGFLVFLQM